MTQDARSRRNHYPGDKARQGEIILKRPWQRVVFIAGLAGVAILAIIAMAA